MDSSVSWSGGEDKSCVGVEEKINLGNIVPSLQFPVFCARFFVEEAHNVCFGLIWPVHPPVLCQ
jgi:hypothetical protein